MRRSSRSDHLSAEEPLEICVLGQSYVVTMRTPGDDFELAAGFLVSEGVISAPEQYATARYCAGAPRMHSHSTATAMPHTAAAHGAEQWATEGNTYNVLDVSLAPGVAPPTPASERNTTMTSACGLCGKTSIDDVRTASAFDIAGDPLEVDVAQVLALPETLRGAQNVFDRTGGLHAAALFDGRTGEMLVLREDVGRHNAVDKVVGWALMNGHLPGRGCVLMVSGRASFELVQKAIMAGIPMLTAVSAPSSLAAAMAEEAGLTLVGFLRGSSMVVYSRPDRIVDAVSEEESV